MYIAKKLREDKRERVGLNPTLYLAVSLKAVVDKVQMPI